MEQKLFNLLEEYFIQYNDPIELLDIDKNLTIKDSIDFLEKRNQRKIIFFKLNKNEKDGGSFKYL